VLRVLRESAADYAIQPLRSTPVRLKTQHPSGRAALRALRDGSPSLRQERKVFANQGVELLATARFNPCIQPLPATRADAGGRCSRATRSCSCTGGNPSSAAKTILAFILALRSCCWRSTTWPSILRNASSQSGLVATSRAASMSRLCAAVGLSRVGVEVLLVLVFMVGLLVMVGVVVG
jgi:hypothetical protein